MHLADAGMMGAEEVIDVGRLFEGLGVVGLVTRERYRTIPVKTGPTIEADKRSIGAGVSSNKKGGLSDQAALRY